MKIYLAIPYSHNPEESFRDANRITAEIMNTTDHIVFSPISHSHPIAQQEKLPSTWEFWKKFDEAFIEWCDELWVVNHDSALVKNSKGVTAEIEIARRLKKPILYLNNDPYRWRILLLGGDCPKCKSVLEVYTNRKKCNSGDKVRCRNCDFTSTAIVDSTGLPWLQQYYQRNSLTNSMQREVDKKFRK